MLGLVRHVWTKVGWRGGVWCNRAAARGSGSVIFDKAVVGESAQLAPGSMLTAGKEIPARQLWGGRPAQFIRDLTDEEVRGLEKGAADAYEAAKAHEAEHKLTAEERMERAEERLYHKQNEAPPEF